MPFRVVLHSEPDDVLVVWGAWCLIFLDNGRANAGRIRYAMSPESLKKVLNGDGSAFMSAKAE